MWDNMHAFVSSLMIAAIGVQAVFGCCWHHAHFHLQCDQSTVHTAGPGHCCKHHHGDDGRPAKPCDGKTDCQGAASYVASQKVRIEGLQQIAPFDIACAAAIRDGSGRACFRELR